jgi:hypothetical protein
MQNLGKQPPPSSPGRTMSENSWYFSGPCLRQQGPSKAGHGANSNGFVLTTRALEILEIFHWAALCRLGDPVRRTSTSVESSYIRGSCKSCKLQAAQSWKCKQKKGMANQLYASILARCSCNYDVVPSRRKAALRWAAREFRTLAAHFVSLLDAQHRQLETRMTEDDILTSASRGE